MPVGFQRQVDPTMTPTLSKWAGTMNEVFGVFGTGVDVFVSSREKIRQRTATPTGVTQPQPSVAPVKTGMTTQTWLLIGAVVLLVLLFVLGGRKAGMPALAPA